MPQDDGLSAPGQLVVGSTAWERAGGPPLTLGQKLECLTGAARVALADLGPRLWWRLNKKPGRRPRRVELGPWAPPDSKAARDAEKFMRDVSSPQMCDHSLRTYYFAAVLYELAQVKPSIDREALYVASVLHDVGLFESPRPANEHCFTVGGARVARGIGREAGWDDARRDRVAVAITTNPNSHVPLEQFGPEAHFMRTGGGVEVFSQEWKVHPENVTEILTRYPRRRFAEDSLEHVGREVKLNPGCRFACLDPVFPWMVRTWKFSEEG